MSDATLRQVIREAQRAGRLGRLGDGARAILSSIAACCQNAQQDNPQSTHWFGRSTSKISNVDDDVSAWRLSAVMDGGQEDARELGAFLAALAELL